MNASAPYADRRSRLSASLPDGLPGVIPWAPGPDAAFFYLTGLELPGAVLLLDPKAADQTRRDILFVRDDSPGDALWDGPLLTDAELLAISGAGSIQRTGSLERGLRRAVQAAGGLAYSLPEPATRIPAPGPAHELLSQIRQWLPLHRIERLAPLLAALRARKDPDEITAIRDATALAGQAFRRLLGFCRPGIREYQAVAELQHEILMAGSRGFGCPPIAAAGRNAVALHYTRCRDTCQDGDLLLVDFTVERHHYHADIARTIPVNGRYTPRQRALCLAVLRIQQAAIRALRPGRTLTECEAETAAAAEEILTRLNLSAGAAPAFRRYCPHALYHHLGLEVHDPAPAGPLAPGNVVTVEPGLYLTEEGIGIRMENNILLTGAGSEDLTAGIPSHPDEIEDLMRI